MSIQLDKYGQTALKCALAGENLFITGKAGTGKTTLLKVIVESLRAKGKVVAVTAPTGVAAHNAEGVTLHSLLHIPLCTYLPGVKIPKLYSLRNSDVEVVKALDVLIIDEVSMVRCDLLDAVDDILRHYRENKKPFGGVQMIMMGDLFQLMPVARGEESDTLYDYYNSLYFFGSKVMKRLNYSMIELQIVHRQDKRSFVRMLNKIRRGKLTESVQLKLRKIYHPKYKGNGNNNQIVLTTHNWMAKRVNNEKLEALGGEEYEFKATAKNWPHYIDYPAKYYLNLKEGARVMFLQNCRGEYYNGMLGTVEEIDDNYIAVRADDGNRLIEVKQYKWDYERYHLDKKTKKLVIEHVGSFIQYPLKLAWAITIHKSQGLTFDEVVIDAGKAFAPGQVYVALSRCRSFEKIVLTSRITPKTVMIDQEVNDYLKNVKTIQVEEPQEPKKVAAKEVKPKKKKSRKKKGDRISETVKTTWELYDQGNTPEEIAKIRELTLTTVIKHLSSLVLLGKVRVFDLVKKDKVDMICDAIKEVGTDSLNAIKEKCPEDVAYEDINLAISYYKYIN